MFLICFHRPYFNFFQNFLKILLNFFQFSLSLLKFYAKFHRFYTENVDKFYIQQLDEFYIQNFDKLFKMSINFIKISTNFIIKIKVKFKFKICYLMLKMAINFIFIIWMNFKLFPNLMKIFPISSVALVLRLRPQALFGQNFFGRYSCTMIDCKILVQTLEFLFKVKI